MSALAAVATSAVSAYATTTSLDGTRQQLAISEQGQITDRFGVATEHLGSGTTDVRLGAIYSLERLMGDSAPDQPTIVELLSAYIRERARVAQERPTIDVQATLTVLGRRDSRNDQNRIVDLTGASLTGADLTHADLARAGLASIKMSRSILNGVNLHDANLQGADLRGDFLVGADLTGADLAGANLNSAYLNGADLSGAQLTGADLRSADFRGADLTGVHLKSACWDKTTKQPSPKLPHPSRPC